MSIHFSSPDPQTAVINLRIAREQIVFLQGFFELYEGVGTVRTLDPSSGLVEILSTPTQRGTVEALLEALRPLIPWSDA